MGVKGRVKRLERKIGPPKETPICFLITHRREGETAEEAVARKMREDGVSYADLEGRIVFQMVI